MRQVPLVTGCAGGDIQGGPYPEVFGSRRQGDLSSSSISGRERLSPRNSPSARQFGGGGTGGGNTGMLGETSTSFGTASTRALGDARGGSAVGAPVIEGGYCVSHGDGTVQPPQPQPQPQPPLPLPAQLRPGEKLRSPDRSSAETMVDAPTKSYGHEPLSGLAAPPCKEEGCGPCPGPGSSVTPHVWTHAALGVTPPTMLAQQPLEVPLIGRSSSPAAGEAGVLGPPLDPSAAAAAGAGTREGPPPALRGSRTRGGLDLTAMSRLGGAGGASTSPPPPPPPSTASSATTCLASGAAPAQPRSGSHDATSGGEVGVSPPAVPEDRGVECEQGRRRAGIAGTVSAEQGAPSAGGDDGVEGRGVTCEAVARVEGSSAGCEVTRPLPPGTISEEERALEERVADAERRLLALQERARLRREAKRELATLHQALASTEKPVPRASPLPLPLPLALALPLALPSGENRPGQSSAMGADRDSDGSGRRTTRSLPLGDRNVNGGGGSGNGSGSGSGSGSGNGSGVGNGNGNGIGNGSGSGSGNGNGDGDGGGGGDGIGNGNGNGNGIGNSDDIGDGNGNGNGNGTPEDAPGGDSSSLSNASRAELLVRMGLVRARLGCGRVAGDSGLRPVAESLWRDVEELGGSGAGGAGANRSAGE